MLKKLYDRCLYYASHKLSKIFLAIVSFIESSFFPIPPDVMIVPMVVAKKEDFLKIFYISTFFSVMGGVLGYFIGYYFLEFSVSIIELYGYEDKVLELQNKMSSEAGIILWVGILFLAGLTPLPYKVFTITSGIVSFNLIFFIIISFIARGLRFFVVSYLSYKFGDKFGQSLKENTERWFIIIGLAVFIIIALLYFYIN
tara:strand:- start:95 stop:691 length:597 start_codon:yes stop_codon:yes gene_type:complete